MKLELVPIPVADIDRAKAFYVEKLGFNADHDTRVSDTLRVVQLTPLGRLVRSSLGSACPKLTTCSLDRSRPCTWSSGTCARRAKCSLAGALRSARSKKLAGALSMFTSATPMAIRGSSRNCRGDLQNLMLKPQETSVFDRSLLARYRRPR